jgi:hypothetical protein
MTYLGDKQPGQEKVREKLCFEPHILWSETSSRGIVSHAIELVSGQKQASAVPW